MPLRSAARSTGRLINSRPPRRLPLQRSEELPISHLDLDTLGAFGDFEAFKVRRGHGGRVVLVVRVCVWAGGDWVGRERTTPPFATQEMMVSCKAGQGCGEMCVMGELMHVHADEQVTYA